MTDDRLTAVLASRIMGWTVGPERFIMDSRRWLPRWRFQPAIYLEDAFVLLQRAAPQEYQMGAREAGTFWAKVRIAGIAGEAHESSQARALTLAIARAIGLET